MQKVIKVDNKVTVFLNNGNFVEGTVTDEEFNKIVNSQSDDEVLKILLPEYGKEVESRNQVLSTIEKLRQSKLLRMYDNTIYWDNVSFIFGKIRI